MMSIFKCKYCSRVYSGGPKRCRRRDCPGNGGGGGARILAAVQEQYPDAAVTLTVDGKSNNDI